MNELGKIAPNAKELEESVIGALMLDRDAMHVVHPILSKEMFYVPVNVLVYKAIHDLFVNREAIDIITVTQKLRSNGDLEAVGGAFAVMQLTNRMTSAANVEFHARIVKEKYLQRQLIKISEQILTKGYNDTTDVFELRDEAEKAIFDLFKDNQGKQESSIAELFHEQTKRIENKKHNEVLGYLTGAKSLDNLLQGIKKQELVILAARPGMGKTSFALTIARNLSTIQNKSVAFFSLEMSSEALCSRFTALHSNIPLSYVINSNVEGVMFEKYMKSVPDVNKSKLYIDDQGGITVMELRSKIRKMVQKYGVEFVFIDYLQKMKAENIKGRSRDNEITEIASGIKDLAKEFDMPIVALAQLSREVEKRTVKRPQLSDLRESGSIEQEADIVCFLYRPDYYGVTTDSDGNALHNGQTEVIIEKNRNGSLGTAQMIFKGDITKFEDLPSGYESQGEYSVYGKDVNNKMLGEDENLF